MLLVKVSFALSSILIELDTATNTEALEDTKLSTNSIIEFVEIFTLPSKMVNAAVLLVSEMFESLI